MTVHSFGATPSPFCSNYALRHVVDDFGKNCSENAFEAILNIFYGDDLLVSVSSTDEAKKPVTNLSSSLRKAGFHLRKWLCNNRETLSEVPLFDLSKAKVLLAEESSHIKRTFSLQWDPTRDDLNFTFIHES